MEYASWEAVPQPIRERMRFSVTLLRPFQTAQPLNCYCTSYQVELSSLRLIDVLADTSDKTKGIVLKSRMTHLSDMVIGGAWCWTLVPLLVKDPKQSDQ